MKKLIINYTVTILAVILIAPGVSFSQTNDSLISQDSVRTEMKSGKLYLIELNDGSEVTGRIEYEDDAVVKFVTVGGIRMEIPKDRIKSREVLSGEIIDGEYLHPDMNRSRLFFGPTGRPLKHGQGYFAVYQIFFPYIGFGLGNIATIGGGMSLFPGLSGQLVYLSGKLTAPLKARNFDLSAGVFYAVPTVESSFNLGVVYGVGTYGTNTSAFTGGIGWGFTSESDDDFILNKPAFLLGGELRFSRSAKFITENWFFLSEHGSGDSKITPVISFGIRFFGRNLAADVGLIYPGADIGGFPFIPWAGFAYNFGGK
jgi:hypothetical protein